MRYESDIPIIKYQESAETEDWRGRCVAMVPINFLLSLAIQANSSHPSVVSSVAELLGGLCSVVLIPLLVVSLLSISPANRNSSSRWKIFFWTTSLILVGQMGRLFGG